MDRDADRQRLVELSGEHHSGANTDRSVGVTFRSFRASAFVALEMYVYLFIAAAFPMAMLSAPLALLVAVPVPPAAWMSWRLSVELGADDVIVRNPLRTHRLQVITAAVPTDGRGPRGSVGCIVFRDAEGRAVPAWAMALFHASPVNERVRWCVTSWAQSYGSRHGVEVQLDPNHRDPEAVRREHYAKIRAEMSFIDPLESIGTVRTAFAGDLLYSIITSPGGFRIVADLEDGRRSYESVVYSTLGEAVAAARQVIADRIANPQADI